MCACVCLCLCLFPCLFACVCAYTCACVCLCPCRLWVCLFAWVCLRGSVRPCLCVCLRLKICCFSKVVAADPQLTTQTYAGLPYLVQAKMEQMYNLNLIQRNELDAKCYIELRYLPLTSTNTSLKHAVVWPGPERWTRGDGGLGRVAVRRNCAKAAARLRAGPSRIREAITRILYCMSVDMCVQILFRLFDNLY